MSEVLCVQQKETPSRGLWKVCLFAGLSSPEPYVMQVRQHAVPCCLFTHSMPHWSLHPSFAKEELICYDSAGSCNRPATRERFIGAHVDQVEREKRCCDGSRRSFDRRGSSAAFARRRDHGEALDQQWFTACHTSSQP